MKTGYPDTAETGVVARARNVCVVFGTLVNVNMAGRPRTLFTTDDTARTHDGRVRCARPRALDTWLIAHALLRCACASAKHFAHPYQPPFDRSGGTRVEHESLVAFASANGEVGQYW